MAEIVQNVVSETLETQITVIVTTSPARSDPELDLIRATFASFKYAGLSNCPKILVADCFNVCEKIKKGSYHRGSLPQDDIDRYKQRLNRFCEAEWAQDVTVLELKSWHGFALATFEALKIVTTPLVCVVQHDLAFNRRINLCPIAELLIKHHAIPISPINNSSKKELLNFIALPKGSTKSYRTKLLSRTRLDVGLPVCFKVSTTTNSTSTTLPLTRLPQFLDGTHIARLEWYLEIFSVPLLHGEPLSKGQFTEDNLGQYMLQIAKQVELEQEVVMPRLESDLSIRLNLGPDQQSRNKNNKSIKANVSQGVLKVIEQFGGWLWYDEESEGNETVEPIIFHLDGRVFLSSSERERKRIPNKDARYSIAEEANNL